MEWHRCFFVIWSWVWVNQWNIIAFPKNHFRRSSSWWLNRHARQIGTLWSISQSVGVKMSNIFETHVIHVWITYTLSTGKTLATFSQEEMAGCKYSRLNLGGQHQHPTSDGGEGFSSSRGWFRCWEDVESFCRSLEIDSGHCFESYCPSRSQHFPRACDVFRIFVFSHGLAVIA